MTNKKAPANSISMIKNIKGKVLGVILARKKVKGGKKYGYGGYGSYGSYGSYGKN